MKTILGRFILLVSVLQLSACGTSTTDDDQQAKASRNDQKLRELYTPLVGQYVGTVQTANTPLTGRMIMYMDTVQDGYDTNGAPLSHTVLKAQLKLDTVGVLDDHTFSVDYKEFDGSANLSQTGGPSAGTPASGAAPGSGSGSPAGAGSDSCLVGEHDSSLAITSGLFRGEDFTGTLIKQSGTIGAVKMHRTSNSNVQPVRDQAERLAAAYQPVAGTYGGWFTAAVKPSDPAGRKSDFPVRLDIVITYVAVAGGVRCPVLQTQYSRPDVLWEDVGLITLNTSFNQGDSQLVFRSADPSGPKYAAISANWNRSSLAGDMSWYTYLGTLSAQRCATNAVDVDGKCCAGNETDSHHKCKPPSSSPQIPG